MVYRRGCAYARERSQFQEAPAQWGPTDGPDGSGAGRVSQIGGSAFWLRGEHGRCTAAEKLHQRKEWSLPALLYTLEADKGWGYRHCRLPSSYLWSFTEHYKPGKVIKDGVFDPQTIDAQCGTATLLRRLVKHQEIVLTDEPALDVPPQVVHYAARRPTVPAIVAAAKCLQEWLSSHPGIALKIGG